MSGMSWHRTSQWLMPVMGVVLIGTGISLLHGWWILLGIPLWLGGVALVRPGLQAVRESNSPVHRRMQTAALAFLVLFFTGAGAFISWAVLSPSGGCVDCDGPWAVPAVVAMNVALCAFAAYLVWQASRRSGGLGRS